MTTESSKRKRNVTTNVASGNTDSKSNRSQREAFEVTLLEDRLVHVPSPGLYTSSIWHQVLNIDSVNSKSAVVKVKR